MIDIYYVEDDENIGRVVKQYLEEKNYKVTVFTTILGIQQAFRNKVPAMALIDWNMPDGSGDALCQWIRVRWKELPIIFLTVRNDSQDIVTGFRNGADDYVVKPFELEVLHFRICALLRRVGDVSEQYISCGTICIDQSSMKVFCEDKEIVLSQSEYQLLLMLMLNKGKTITRERLLEQIWDTNGNYVNNNTLTVTMKRLREKLNKPSCLKTIRSFGYRMEDMI